MTYIKETFDAVTFDQAKNIVLTPDPSDPKKFERETNFFVDCLLNQNILNEHSLVLDFGCGMGRISKELVGRVGCKVLGVDISDSMLSFAMLNVASLSKFTTLNSYTTPETVDVCVCTFVLQHVEDPEYEIQNLYNVLKPNGYLVLLNENHRYVPSDVDENRYVVWHDDEFDVLAKCHSLFQKTSSVKYCNTDKEIIFFQKPGNAQ
jgi:2-polyprenyl-3-methyl-5-hydroxy-6-metoxy-1,4-benzoquinol methylase